MSYVHQKDALKLAENVNVLKAMVLDVMEHQGVPVTVPNCFLRVHNNSKGRIQVRYYLGERKEDSDMLNDLVKELDSLEHAIFGYVY